MIKIVDEKLLSDNWYVLKKMTFEYPGADGTPELQSREVYDRGNGATILLIDHEEKNVILTRQFRIPTYLNGNADGLLLETCAGALDGDSPEECVRREAVEETGYSVSNVRKVFEAYMSPGAVTEIIYGFIGDVSRSSKVSDGGGLAHESENIEVITKSFSEIRGMLKSGEFRDAKTIMLVQHALLEGLLEDSAGK